ncbi:MAG: hypothetical protein WBD20_23485 [Pirellulaceae bacterium]
MGTICETLDNMVDGFMDRRPFIVLELIVFMICYLIAGFARKRIRNSIDGKEFRNVGRVQGDSHNGH